MKWTSLNTKFAEHVSFQPSFHLAHYYPRKRRSKQIIRLFVFAVNNSIHEVVSHLGNTHIVMEGPVVAMNRQLPKEHPVYALLKPHLEGTAAINYAAQQVCWCLYCVVLVFVSRAYNSG